MKLKTVEIDGTLYAPLSEGNPVLVSEDGAETPFDVARSVGKIRDLNRENQKFREGKQAAEERLRAFEGIEDPTEAREALEFRRNAKDGEFVAAGKVEEIKNGLKRTFEEQHAATVRASAQRIQELEKNLSDVTSAYDGEVIGNAFSNSKFIRDKIAVPIGMIRSTFGGQFKLEDGKLAAYHADGSRIMSATGDVASFDEAMERIVNAYPDKDLILKGTGSTGSGAQPSRGGSGGSKTMTQAAFDALGPMEQAKVMSGPDRPAIVN